MTDSFGDGWNGAFLDITVPALGVSLGSFTLEEGTSKPCPLAWDATRNRGGGRVHRPTAFNYDPYATVDDGTCSYDCECEDVDAPVCGYDYLTGTYTTYANACEAECAQAWIVSEGDCAAQPVYGCTDENAVNYNPDATDDDGSCVVVPECGDDQMLAVATLTTACGVEKSASPCPTTRACCWKARLHRLRHNGRLLLLGRHCGVPRADHGGQLRRRMERRDADRDCAL